MSQLIRNIISWSLDVSVMYIFQSIAKARLTFKLILGKCEDFRHGGQGEAHTNTNYFHPNHKVNVNFIKLNE